METRRLGKTGLVVSEIGFGAWQLGNDDDWEGMDERSALDLVAAACDRGVNLFDTAPNYAATGSERLLGKALVGRRHDVVLVSKFGHPPTGPKDFAVERFVESLEASLRRLRTDYLDVLLLHNPPPEMYDGADPLWEALARAREQGKIRHYGASLDFAAEIEACLANTGSEVLEVLFNILHQDARRAFPLARAADAGIIAKVPLDSGWLTGRFDAQSRFAGIRSRWSREQIVRRAALVDQLRWLATDRMSLATAALAYVLAYDEVGCVIPGIRTREQLEVNTTAAGMAMSRPDKERLESFWDTFTDGGRELLPW